MDRGAWQATVHGVATVGHNLTTTPPPPPGRRQDRHDHSRVWLCDCMDYRPPGYSVHRDFPGKVLEWVAISSSSVSSWPGIKLTSPALKAGLFFFFFLTTLATGEAHCSHTFKFFPMIMLLFFSSELTVNSHAVVRNPTERSCMPITQFPPKVTSYTMIAQNHNQEIDIWWLFFQ